MIISCLLTLYMSYINRARTNLFYYNHLENLEWWASTFYYCQCDKDDLVGQEPHPEATCSPGPGRVCVYDHRFRPLPSASRECTIMSRSRRAAAFQNEEQISREKRSPSTFNELFPRVCCKIINYLIVIWFECWLHVLSIYAEYIRTSMNSDTYSSSIAALLDICWLHLKLTWATVTCTCFIQLVYLHDTWHSKDVLCLTAPWQQSNIVDTWDGDRDTNQSVTYFKCSILQTIHFIP